MPTEAVSMAGEHPKGSPRATVGILEFSDLACLFCGAFVRDTLPQLEDRCIKPGAVLFAFRHSPLQQVHPDAIRASIAAKCAGRPGRFWEMHAALFRRPSRPDADAYSENAASVGLDRASFESCAAGADLTDARGVVRRNLREGGRVGVATVPVFFLGRMRGGSEMEVTTVMDGAAKPERFQSALDALLGR
jgi:protein-disulfide isomerase